MAGPRRCMKAPASRGSMAVIGLPCEMKSGGRVEVLSMIAIEAPRARPWVQRGRTQHSPRPAPASVASVTFGA